TLVYGWHGYEFVDYDFEARRGGFFSIKGLEFSAAIDTDYTCPDTQIRVQVNNRVVRTTKGNISQWIKHVQPTFLERLRGYPSGWYGISMAVGKHTCFNTPGARRFWSRGTSFIILALGLLLFCFPGCLIPWAFLFGPIAWMSFYAPTRLHLPSSFFNDGAEAFASSEHVHKAIKAEEVTLLSYFGS